MGPPTMAAATMLRPGLVPSVAMKSGSLPCLMVAASAHRALQLSLIALASVGRMKTSMKPPAGNAVDQSTQMPWVCAATTKAEYRPYAMPENRAMAMPFLKKPCSRRFFFSIARDRSCVAVIEFVMAPPVL